jgi:phenylacetate-coenzyme A ligase PaaK-like adenylate-forming protein
VGGGQQQQQQQQQHMAHDDELGEPLDPEEVEQVGAGFRV